MENNDIKTLVDVSAEAEGRDAEERLTVEIPVEVRAGDWSLLNCIKKLPSISTVE